MTAGAAAHRRMWLLAIVALAAAITGWLASHALVIPRQTPLFIAGAAALAYIVVVSLYVRERRSPARPAVSRTESDLRRAAVRADLDDRIAAARSRDPQPTRDELRVEFATYLRERKRRGAFRTDDAIDAELDDALRSFE